MLNRNKIDIGFIVALIFPVMVRVFENIFKTTIYELNEKGMLYFLSLAINLFIIRYCYKKGYDKTGMGAIMGTFIMMIYLFLFKAFNAA